MVESAESEAVASAGLTADSVPPASRFEAGLTGITAAFSGLVGCSCCYYSLSKETSGWVGGFSNAQINTTFYPTLLASVAVSVKARSWVDRLAERARRQGRRTDPRADSLVPIWPNMAMVACLVYWALFGSWTGDALTSPIFPAAERTTVVTALLYMNGLIAALLTLVGTVVAIDELGIGSAESKLVGAIDCIASTGTRHVCFFKVHDMRFYLHTAAYAPISVILFAGNKGFLFGIGYLLGGLSMLSLVVASRGCLPEDSKSEEPAEKSGKT